MALLIRALTVLALAGCAPSFEPLEPPDDDLDGDGYAAGADCDDRNPSIYPEAPDPVGDGVDANCDGGDGYDRDQDGFYTDTDCDDTDASVFPGAEDAPYDGVDSDCDRDRRWEEDHDGDGYAATVVGGPDCDDENAAIFPNAREVCNRIDDNCDGRVDEPGSERETVWYVDADADGYGTDTFERFCFPQDAFWSKQTGDCDDTDPAVNPGQEEVCGDGLDNDCDAAVPAACGLYGLVTVPTHGVAWTVDTGRTSFVADVGVADVTGDGRDDLVLAGAFDDQILFVQSGPYDAGGRITDSTPGWTAIQWVDPTLELGFGDLDDDGAVELLFSAQRRGVVLLEAPVGSGRAIDTEEDGILRNSLRDDFAGALDVFDRDGDGDDDLLVSDARTTGPRSLALFDGPLDEAVDTADADFRLDSDDGWRGRHTLVEDFDGTGAYGVAIAGNYSEATLFSLADDGIVDFAGYAPRGDDVSAPGDVDGDGYPDLIVADTFDSYLLLGPFDDEESIEAADGTFIYGGDGTFVGGDLNGDGVLDLVFGGSRPGILYGPVTDARRPDANLPGEPGQLVDTNGDGLLDVIGRQRDGAFILFGGAGP